MLLACGAASSAAGAGSRPDIDSADPPSPAPVAPTTTPRSSDSAPASGAHGEQPLARDSPGVTSAKAPDVAPEQSVDDDVRLAQDDALAGRHQKVIVRLGRALPRLDREASLDERLLARTLLGGSQRALSNAKSAKRHYAEVVRLWANPAAALEQIRARETDERRALRRVARALTSVGEALFFAAEEKRRVAQSLRPPAYHGPATQAAIEKYARTKLLRWLGEKRKAVDDAEQSYRKIVELKPAPPPRWVVASAASVASMTLAFARDFETLPVPRNIARDPALASQYASALRDATRPLRERARATLRMCRDYSEKYRYADATTDRCATDLATLDASPP